MANMFRHALRIAKQRREDPPAIGLFNAPQDIRENMKMFVDREALADMKTSPNDIVRKCFDHFNEKLGKNWCGLQRGAIINRVHNTRRHVAGMGGGAKFKLMSELMASGSKSMMRFESSYFNGETREEVIGFSHPLLSSVLKRPVSSYFVQIYLCEGYCMLELTKSHVCTSSLL